MVTGAHVVKLTKAAREFEVGTRTVKERRFAWQLSIDTCNDDSITMLSTSCEHTQLGLVLAGPFDLPPLPDSCLHAAV